MLAIARGLLSLATRALEGQILGVPIPGETWYPLGPSAGQEAALKAF